MKVETKQKLYMALLKPISWLPMWGIYALGTCLRLLFQHVIHYRIKVIRQNLTTSFPHYTPRQLRQVETEFYSQFADNIVESIKLLNISNKTINKRVEVRGAELVEEIARQGRPIFLYLGHYCNWEWVPAITFHYSEPRVSAQIYKPLHDAAFDRVMLKVRSRFNSLNIPQDRALRTLVELRRNQGTFIVGIIDDHRPNHERSQHYMDFLNHPHTIINVGGEEIGRRLDAAFVYLDIFKPRRGHYTMTFLPIEPQADDIATGHPYSYRYMKMLEQTICRQPGYWLWSHRRWLKL